jgi:hypothetical protein
VEREISNFSAAIPYSERDMAFLYKRNAVSLAAKGRFAKSVLQMSNHSKSTIFEFFTSKVWKFQKKKRIFAVDNKYG